jgi:hypothetical protein
MMIYFIGIYFIIPYFINWFIYINYLLKNCLSVNFFFLLLAKKIRWFYVQITNVKKNTS